MKVEIKNRFNGGVIFSLETKSLSLAVEAAVKQNADLRSANLGYADLRSADLRYANLRYADLGSADLRSADLGSADLGSANLGYANLGYADLRSANLRSADLRYAESVRFPKLPSMAILSNIHLGTLPHKIAKELMRRDAAAHPHPDRFVDWSKGGPCPYQDEELFWKFTQNKKDWRKGRPVMGDVDLILAICKAKGWKIANYLD